MEEDQHPVPGCGRACGPDQTGVHGGRLQAQHPVVGRHHGHRPWEGWLYLVAVIDTASRRVIGYALADHLRTELINNALSNAVAARSPRPSRSTDRPCLR
jgi:transposase InsO family protein